MKKGAGAARTYTLLAGIFLLLQGTSTLAFRLYAPLDHAFPLLLAATQMHPPHSWLHIVTGLLALAAIFSRRPRSGLYFAAGFGVFYTGLALYGLFSHKATWLELQPFDHPFHLLLGLAGIVCAALSAKSELPRKAQS